MWRVYRLEIPQTNEYVSSNKRLSKKQRKTKPSSTKRNERAQDDLGVFTAIFWHLRNGQSRLDSSVVNAIKIPRADWFLLVLRVDRYLCCQSNDYLCNNPKQPNMAYFIIIGRPVLAVKILNYNRLFAAAVWCERGYGFYGFYLKRCLMFWCL